MDVDDAILSRNSVRRFLETPVSRDTVTEILRVASRAPSSTNMQPWKVYACAGAVRAALVADVRRALETEPEVHTAERRFYPDPIPEPYRGRRRVLGLQLYEALGIEMEDRERRDQQYARNFTFFDAPVGLFVAVDKVLEVGSWLDCGLFIQTVMLAARGRGLDTCVQASWTRFHTIVRRHLEIPEDEALVCAIALGHADPAAPENLLRSERIPVEEFAVFKGFG